eukprot:CAMPEP_0201713686 /NCGR_PEP_ID=MMETSP0593-20130828/433_1 /ASSEMBLY_ACC=CAM_ASM_000672 /TAXON_ID=267983 /ORGANISM="Skeletonema japonicum, Strain CCMP2506" /LENGTH=623 /DNA_ID=CAMNT_0048202863 /DNA_START=75 /DNA_END=1946 /DNA_ORIENTATION=+
MDLVGNFVKDLNIDKVRNLAEDAFNQVKPKNDVEVRVYEVLSHKNWGASSTLLNEIAQDTFDYERFLIVTKLMWEAIETPRPAAWRVIFKGLTLLEHLVKNGSERCVDDARNHSHLLRSMDRFNYYEGTVDRGQGVREKAKQITDILGDDERIREERTKARQLREKFAGRSMTNSSSTGGGGGGGGGSTKYAGYGNSDAGWNSKSSGYGESGIGATSSGRDSSDRGYAGRYGEGGVDSGSSRKTSDTVPTRKSSKSGSSSKVKKSKKKEKKAGPVAPAPAAPEVDLFGFDDVPTSTPAQADNSFDAFQSAGAPAAVAAPPAANDDFGDFQQIAPSSAVQFDAFGSAPAPQQASFDAFGSAPSQPPAAVGNNMNTMNDAFGNMNFQSAPAPAATMPAPATSGDDDDFGDFADAEPSAKSNVTSSDPLSKLISLDGLSKNTKKQVKKESFNTAAPQQYGFQPHNNSQPVLGVGQEGDIGEVFGQLMTNNQQAQAQQRMAQQMNQQIQPNTGMNMMGGNNNMMGGMQGNQMGMQQMSPQMMGGQMMGGGMQGQGMGGMSMQGNTNNMQGNMNMQGMGMQSNMNNMQGGMGGMNNNNMNMNQGGQQMGGQQMSGMNGMMGGQQQQFR